jgi:hypothetical protein
MTKDELQAAVPFLRLAELLGQGGNAFVYAGTDIELGGRMAIKFFINPKPKRFQRFVDEVLVVTNRLKDNPHVIPILQSDLYRDGAMVSTPWYTMPIGVTLRDFLSESSWTERLSIMANLADGLASLHRLDVAHRDLKPENMLVLDGRPRLSDFGIAKFPEAEGITTATEPMGPAGYIAPEMMRDTASANASMADVYSFAKSVWSILTGNKTPFVGQYTIHHTAALQRFCPAEFVHESLDELLSESTDPDPLMRPAAGDLANRLRGVIELQADFATRNSAQWAAAARQALLLPGLVQTRWEGITEIAAVVNVLSRRRSLNHCFFPDGGGQDISDAHVCEDGRMLALGSLGSFYVVSPKSLTLETFPGNVDLSYAVLETADVEVLGAQATSEWSEEVWQMPNGIDYRDVNDDEVHGRDIAKRCSRYFKGGRLILAPKAGMYNKIDDYTGEWNQMPPHELRAGFDKIARSAKGQAPTSPSSRASILPPNVDRPTATFHLRYLRDEDLRELIRLDDAMMKNTERGTAELSTPDDRPDTPALVGPRDPLHRKEAVRFLDTLSDSQVREYLLLTYLGRGDLDLHDYDEQLRTPDNGRHHVDYLRGLLGNGYLRRALEKFGVSGRLRPTDGE